MNLLLNLWQSKHTSAAGLLVIVCALGEIWLPQYTEQFHKTREFAMAYGLLMGADAVRRANNNNNNQPKQTNELPQTNPQSPDLAPIDDRTGYTRAPHIDPTRGPGPNF